MFCWLQMFPCDTHFRSIHFETIGIQIVSSFLFSSQSASCSRSCLSSIKTMLIAFYAAFLVLEVDKNGRGIKSWV